MTRRGLWVFSVARTPKPWRKPLGVACGPAMPARPYEPLSCLVTTALGAPVTRRRVLDCPSFHPLPGRAGLLAIWNSPSPRSFRRPFGGTLCAVYTSLCKSSIRRYLAWTTADQGRVHYHRRPYFVCWLPLRSMQIIPLRSGI